MKKKFYRGLSNALAILAVVIALVGFIAIFLQVLYIVTVCFVLIVALHFGSRWIDKR